MIAINAGRIQNRIAQRYLTAFAMGQNMDGIETGAIFQHRRNLLNAIGPGIQHYHFSPIRNG